MKAQTDVLDTELENKIYMLCSKNLSKDLNEMIIQADIAYLQNRNTDAWQLIYQIEKEMGILGN